MKNLALIDADSIYFKIAYKITDKQLMKRKYKRFIKDIELNTFCDDSIVACKGPDNFRKELYSGYKANRKPLDPDVGKRINYLHKYSLDLGAIPSDGMEADDLVAIWAHEAREAGDQYVVCHIDKDLDQIPGNHYNYTKNTHYFMNDDEADFFFCKQLLTGDSTDNIPGLKGIGMKTAEKILQGVPYERRLEVVKSTWRSKAGKGYAGRLALSANLLYMWRRSEDFFDVDEVRSPLKREGAIRE